MTRKQVLAGGAGAVGVLALMGMFALWRWPAEKIATPPEAQPAPPAPQAEVAKLPRDLEEIVARYRKITVLLEDDAALSQAQKDRASLIGRLLFQENHQALSALSTALTDELTSPGSFSAPPPKITRFLDLIEGQQELHDADKLSFREVFTDIADALKGVKSAAAAKVDLEKRVEEDRQALAEIQSVYEKPDHVFTLLNEQATREKILSVLGDTLANPKKVQREDRVFVFFAGHGATRKLPSGRDLGYIVPVDADLENFQGQSISMTNFQDISEAIPAKHVFFVMDSCYSGLALTRGQPAANYIREVSRRTARQMLTAGGADEEVADNGPNGHSIFTWTLLQGLEGKADLNADGYVSAGELASYVAPSVSGLSRQTPSFGALPGNEGGEFVSELHPETEFLSGLSIQLDREAIQLNAELDRIRKEVAEKTARNQQLREQLTVAQAAAQPGAAPAAAAAAPPRDTVGARLNTGMSLFKEQRYPQALDEYLAAARLDPASAVAANNVGFVYHKMGKLDDAIKWLDKTIVIDPRRGIAYANLGDVYFDLKRPDDARRAYQKFLDVSPSSAYAATVRVRLGELNSRPQNR